MSTELAVGVGFEPTRVEALPVFKTGALNHSAIPPEAGLSNPSTGSRSRRDRPPRQPHCLLYVPRDVNPESTTVQAARRGFLRESGG